MRRQGFTLIEMVVTLTIISILAMASLPLAEGLHRYTREQELRAALRDIRRALDQYKEAVDTGRIAMVTPSGYPPNLAVLVSGVPDLRNPGKAFYFLRRLPRDPFCPAQVDDAQCWAPRAFTSPPEMPAPGLDVFDVHSTSDEIGSDGRPYRSW